LSKDTAAWRKSVNNAVGSLKLLAKKKFKSLHSVSWMRQKKFRKCT
jgi:hypothetical protein